MSYFLGLDIGCVSAKAAIIDENGSVLHLDSQKIIAGPGSAIASLFSGIPANINKDLITGAGVSGSGRDIFPPDLEWGNYSSSISVASGILQINPDARTIIQIGGQSSMVIELEDGLKKPWKVATNPLCAAGTGRFLEQQAYRLGIDMEEFAGLAMKYSEDPPRIAARCSVFAKSDLIHLQQKGAPIEAILASLCESVARMIVSLKKGTFIEPVYFTGGLAASPAIVRALNSVISARNKKPAYVIVPENYLFIEAIGSAFLSRDRISKIVIPEESDNKQRYYHMPALAGSSIMEPSVDRRLDTRCTGYLGVDIGSTSTKAVIIDETGKKVLLKNYLMTAGKPVDAIRQVFRNLLKDGANKVDIKGVGVTGSGRYLIGSFIGADLIKNEITAQTRAAAEIDADADIIEIGGQDSKLVLKRNGVVIDYQMNKACAAGTGSFIDELAEMLGVSVTNGDFAAKAFNAENTIDLGTRCAAFMGQAVATAQQEGLPLNVILASLSNSIAKNYLSKVVGNRKLGDKVILTGAVFYNQAVVSAFRNQLPGKNLVVAEHKEITGAIGAALLAKESANGDSSRFHGFNRVVDSECKLSTFVCKSCDNNCTITRMQTEEAKPTFYGSRCDRYDSTIVQSKQETFFDEREKLLFRDYREGEGNGPVVGIPRALLVYDYAPMLIGFLNALGVRVLLSSKTTGEIIERATELSYTDSCFPVKVLHGHVTQLNNTDYILFPSLIRLGEQDGAENQKYACPLVQASPYIIRQALDLSDRMLIPTVDFSHGQQEVIKSLTGIAVRLGFKSSKGKAAAIAGIEAQKKYEYDRNETGQKLLKELEESGKTGVVIFSRAYMSQDSGANLGIAEKLAQLGVVPVPMDFLPLSSVDPKKYSDRPYWFYESKFIAAAAITASNPNLFGLILTNFGCGPNSFMIRMVEDIMGSKPLGQLEIDEHAAEAGIVTRLEAFVDTINGYRGSEKYQAVPAAEVYRGASPVVNTQKTILLPKMASHAAVLAAAMNACGARAIVLPEADERNILYSSEVTLGTECLPYRVCLGDFLRFYHENGHNLKDVEGFMPGSYGPCRLGKYSIEHMRVLKRMGINMQILTTVSNSAYRDLNLGTDFERLAWKGLVAFDYLEKLVWRSRPYEVKAGAADALFDEFSNEIAQYISRKETFDHVLKKAASQFRSIISPDIPRRPVVGINGEIFLRTNKFSNSNLVKACENAGLEVMVSSLGEWFKYTSYRNLEDAVNARNYKKAAVSLIKKKVQEYDERRIGANCDSIVEHDPSTERLLELSGSYLSSKCGSEAVLSLGSGIEWLESPHFAGAISVMPHGCMPGGIVAAMADKFSAMYQKPWISLTYDGFMETNNLARINNFAEIIKYCRKENLQQGK